MLIVSTNAHATNVSLYFGQERSFSPKDFHRVLQVLEALGLDHELSADRQILVPMNQRPQTRDLVAQSLRRVTEGPKELQP
jgi:hypothetical protein